jgi:hypothetical protein
VGVFQEKSDGSIKILILTFRMPAEYLPSGICIVVESLTIMESHSKTIRGRSSVGRELELFPHCILLRTGHTIRSHSFHDLQPFNESRGLACASTSLNDHVWELVAL